MDGGPARPFVGPDATYVVGGSLGMGGFAHFLYVPETRGRDRVRTNRWTGRVNRKERELEQLLAPTVQGLGCEMWGVEYFPAGRPPMLRVYIDAPEGVTVDDCERVSHQLSGVLDVEAPIRGDYTLEVSSPGLDRVLFKPEQYAAYVGEDVDVRLRFPFEGMRKVVGRLAEASAGEVVVEADGAAVAVPVEQIRRTRLVPRF